MNTITVENIKNLDAKKLTQLLLKLLHLENNKFRFPDCNIYVPENITTADGGEDGRILTSDFKDSKWIVGKFCLFQSKATSMSRAECKNEVLNTANSALKKQVKEVFDEDGTYILFIIDDYVQQNFGDMPNVFLDWNQQDPVSQYEINRNNILNTLQGNRNPFIDNPYLATIIWNGPQATDTWGILSTQNNIFSNITIYPTITKDIIHISNTNNTQYTYKIYNTFGQLIDANTTTDIIDITNNTKGLYLINLQLENQTKTFKVILN